MSGLNLAACLKEAVTERPAPEIKDAKATVAVEQFCGRCHVLPAPEVLPDRIWEREIPRMFALAGAANGGPGLPSVKEALDYYLQRAPSEVTLPKPKLSSSKAKLKFVGRGDRPSPQAPPNPGISSVRWEKLFAGKKRSLLMTDMRHGVVAVQVPGRPGSIIARAAFPAGTAVVDLDKDGQKDVLVAELGTFGPAETDRGGVLWLRQYQSKSGPGFRKIQLLEKLGRVASVCADDLDGDGDVDIVLGVFGLLSTGKVLWLENLGKAEPRGKSQHRLDKVPLFRTHVLDPRPGATEVSIGDINGDGRKDIVAVLGQHFEEVVAYINQGESGFELRVLYKAPHPDWGMMRAVLVDLDKDKDVDVVMVNGDVMDTPVAKPFHGIRWLENKGELGFRVHEISPLMGASAVKVADLDHDGDFDIVASAFIPAPNEEVRKPGGYEALLWFEQTSHRQFTGHRIESVTADHPALELGDLNYDGRLDRVVGHFTIGPTERPDAFDWLKIYTNTRL